jgi:hypothetical protein
MDMTTQSRTAAGKRDMTKSCSAWAQNGDTWVS